MFFGLDQLNICIYGPLQFESANEICEFSKVLMKFQGKPSKTLRHINSGTFRQQFTVVLCLMEKVAVGRKYVKGHATREEPLCAHKLGLTHTLTPLCVCSALPSDLHAYFHYRNAENAVERGSKRRVCVCVCV